LVCSYPILVLVLIRGVLDRGSQLSVLRGRALLVILKHLTVRMILHLSLTSHLGQKPTTNPNHGSLPQPTLATSQRSPSYQLLHG
jgi:hypothetical protein